MKKVEKIQEIIQTTGWSQAKLAKALGVSAKTLNLWLNGKSEPQAKRFSTIDKVYQREVLEARKKEIERNDDPDFSQKILRGILLEEQAKTDPEDKYLRTREKHRDYYNGKIVAKKLEEDNLSRIIIFPSINEGERKEWYKIGGNSALFYKYYIGPRIGRSPRIIEDSDLRIRFRNGVTMVHMMDNLLKDLEDVGCKISEGEFGLIFVEMDKVFTEKEAREMAATEKENQERVRRMIMPKENLPDIYNQIRRLAQILPPKVKRMDGAYRTIFGEGVLGSVYEMYKIYFQLGNGHLEKKEAFLAMVREVDNVTAVLAVADENKIFDLTTRIRIGEGLAELKMALAKRLKNEDD